MKRLAILFLVSLAVPAFAVKHAQLSFNKGELSPLMLMRSDFEGYDNGCSILQNMLPLSQGPVMRRPGTYYIAETETMTEKSELIPFEYSWTDTYMLEFGDFYMRVFREDPNGDPGQVLDDADAIYELTTVFSESEVADIQYIQLADVMFLVNSTDPPQKLSRLGHASWTIEDVNYVDGPFMDEYVVAALQSGTTVNFASQDESATASESSVYGTASGAIASTNDDDHDTYRRYTGDENSIFQSWYDSTAYFTIEIAFNSAIDLSTVNYKIGWSSTTWLSQTVSCKVHYDTANVWTEISTDITPYTSVGGEWDDVNGIKISLYGKTGWITSGHAILTLYEFEAFGHTGTQTGATNYFTPSNTASYNRTLDAAAAVDQAGSPNVVRIPSTAHGFLANDYVVIGGTTNYDGTYKITNINDVDTFDIEVAYNAETFGATDTASSRISIYATKNTFESDHVGALWKIRHPRTDAKLSGSLGSATASSAIACEGDYSLTTHGTWTGTVTLERTSDGGTTYEEISESTRSSVNDDNIDFNGNEPDPGYSYRVRMNPYTSGTATYTFNVFDHMHTGIVRTASYIDPNEITATVLTDLSAVTKTTYWSEGYWSDKNGWPRTIEFHEFRLWYGGSTDYPQTIWASKTDDYELMKDGTDDDDAMIYLLPGQNPIQWMLSHNYLMIGTLGGAGRLGETDEPMAPTTQPQYINQSTDGSSYNQAILAGNAILYLENGGKKVREFVYAFEQDKFVSPDMTVLAEHITGNGITSMAYQSRTDSTLWCVRGDGHFLSMTYNRSQQVIGWADHVTDGEVESIAVIPGDTEDEVWMIVKRTIDSNDVRYVEKMMPRDWGSDDNDTFFVDSGLTWDGGDVVAISGVTQADPAVITVTSWPVDGDGSNLVDDDQIKIVSIVGMTELNGNIYTMDDANVSAKTFSLNNSANTANIDSTNYTTYTSGGTAQRFENSFSGFDHLEGETASILGDGTVQTSQTVSSGAFIIDTWVNKLHAGMPYTSKLETLPIIIEGAIGSRMTVNQVAINFHDSLGFEYGVEDDTDSCFSDTELFTGWRKLRFQHGFSDEMTVYLESDKPLPGTIRAIISSVTITER